MFIIDSKFKKIAKLMGLKKPLVIFDVETTGLNISQDKIVEIAYVKIMPGGATKEDDLLLNPEIKISAEATAVHGITNEMVAEKPRFKDVAQNLWEIFTRSDFAGFNIINFDLPLLRREFLRIGMDFNYRSEEVFDAKEIFNYMSPRSLSSAYQYYCGKELKLGHTAPLNTQVAADVILKQLEKYKEVRDPEFIKKINRQEEDNYVDVARKFYWRRGEAFFSFSKYKDRALNEIVKEDPKFLEWILESDFSEGTKEVVRQALYKTKDKKLSLPSSFKG